MSTYKPQVFYRILTFVAVFLILLFGWDLLGSLQGSEVEIGAILFFAISIGILCWALRASMTVVSADSERLTVTQPLSRAKTIEYGQILTVSEEGRLLESIVISYHPRTKSGLLDLDTAESLTLPAVEQQAELHTLLTEKAPV